MYLVNFFIDCLFWMTSVISNFSLETIIKLYIPLKPDKKGSVIKKVGMCYLVSDVIQMLDNIIRLPENVHVISAYLELLIDYTLWVKSQMSPENISKVWGIYLFISSWQPNIIDYDKYSKFLFYLFSSLSSLPKVLIHEKISNLKKEYALIPAIHFAIMNKEYLDSTISYLINSNSLFGTQYGIQQCSEAFIILLRSKTLGKYSIIDYFSFVDVQLSKQIPIFLMVRLLESALEFFSENEVLQLFRIHFNNLICQLNSKAGIGVVRKVFEFSAFIAKNSIEKNGIIEIVFKQLLVYYVFEQNINDYLLSICSLISQESLFDLIDSIKNNTNMAHAWYFLISKYPKDSSIIDILKPTVPDIKLSQIECINELISSNKMPIQYWTILFSVLDTSQFLITKKLFDYNKSGFVSACMHYIQRNVDIERINSILELLSELKELPICQDINTSSIAATICSLFFTNKMSNLFTKSLLDYLCVCNTDQKSNFSFEQTSFEYPYFIHDYFENKEKFRNGIIEESLLRIRKEESLQVLTLCALTNNFSVITHCILMIGSDQTKLRLLLIALGTNNQSEFIKTIEFLLTDQSKNRSFLLNLIFTSPIDSTLTRTILSSIDIINKRFNINDKVINIFKFILKTALTSNDTHYLYNLLLKLVSQMNGHCDFNDIIIHSCDSISNSEESMFVEFLSQIIPKSSVFSDPAKKKVLSTWGRLLSNSKNPILDSELERLMFPKTEFSYLCNYYIKVTLKYMKVIDESIGLLSSLSRLSKIVPFSDDCFLLLVDSLLSGVLSKDNQISQTCISIIQSCLKISNGFTIENVCSVEIFKTALPFYVSLVEQMLPKKMLLPAFLLKSINLLPKMSERTQVSYSILFFVYFSKITKPQIVEMSKLLNVFHESFSMLNSSTQYISMHIYCETLRKLISNDPLLIIKSYIESNLFSISHKISAIIVNTNKFSSILFSIIQNYLFTDIQIHILKNLISLFGSFVEIVDDLSNNAQKYGEILFYFLFLASLAYVYQQRTKGLVTIVNQNTYQVYKSLFNSPNLELEASCSKDNFFKVLLENLSNRAEIFSQEIQETLLSQLEKIRDTEHSLLYLVFLTKFSFFSFNKQLCFKSIKQLSSYYISRPNTLVDQVLSISITSSETAFIAINNLEIFEKRALFSTHSHFIGHAIREKILKGFECYSNHCLAIDDEFFLIKIEEILVNLRRVILTDNKMVYSEPMIALFKKMKAKQPNMQIYIAGLPELYTVLLPMLFTDRNNVQPAKLAIFGDTSGFEATIKSSYKYFGREYMNVVTKSVAAASSLQCMTDDMITDIMIIIGPIKENNQLQSSQVIDNIKILLQKSIQNGSNIELIMNLIYTYFPDHPR